MLQVRQMFYSRWWYMMYLHRTNEQTDRLADLPCGRRHDVGCIRFRTATSVALPVHTFQLIQNVNFTSALWISHTVESTQHSSHHSDRCHSDDYHSNSQHSLEHFVLYTPSKHMPTHLLPKGIPWLVYPSLRMFEVDSALDWTHSHSQNALSKMSPN